MTWYKEIQIGNNVVAEHSDSHGAYVLVNDESVAGTYDQAVRKLEREECAASK